MIKHLKLSLLLFCIACSVISCSGDNKPSNANLNGYRTGSFTLPNSDVFSIVIAESSEQQRLGLSRIKNEDFDSETGILFPSEKMLMRQFWMPETYFDLDIVFMDKNYLILDIHRALKHYPFKAKKDEVPMSRKVLSQHVLEVKSHSALSNQLQIGMKLVFKAE